MMDLIAIEARKTAKTEAGLENQGVPGASQLIRRSHPSRRVFLTSRGRKKQTFWSSM